MQVKKQTIEWKGYRWTRKMGAWATSLAPISQVCYPINRQILLAFHRWWEQYTWIQNSGRRCKQSEARIKLASVTLLVIEQLIESKHPGFDCLLWRWGSWGDCQPSESLAWICLKFDHFLHLENNGLAIWGNPPPCFFSSFLEHPECLCFPGRYGGSSSWHCAQGRPQPIK